MGTSVGEPLPDTRHHRQRAHSQPDMPDQRRPASDHGT